MTATKRRRQILKFAYSSRDLVLCICYCHVSAWLQLTKSLSRAEWMTFTCWDAAYINHIHTFKLNKVGPCPQARPRADSHFVPKDGLSKCQVAPVLPMVETVQIIQQSRCGYSTAHADHQFNLLIALIYSLYLSVHNY